MNQQKRFQSGIEFIINLISLFASHAVAYLIFGLIIPKIQNYERNDRVEYTIVLLLSAIIVFLYFSVEINFSVRNREFELTSTLKNCFLTYALFGVMLILTKNPIIDSRYLFLSSFAFYIAFSLLGRYVFKHYMIKKISKSKFATRVGVISTYGRACEFIPKLKENWTNNVIAVALIDTDFNENGFVLKNGKSIFDIDGAKIEEKQTEFNVLSERVLNYDDGLENLKNVEEMLDTAPEYQLSEPQGFMTAKAYKTKIAEPLIQKLKALVKTALARCFEGWDNYHRLNITNGNLYRENEMLSKINSKLKSENENLRSEVKDYKLLRKVFGHKQIDELLENIKGRKRENTRSR